MAERLKQKPAISPFTLPTYITNQFLIVKHLNGYQYMKTGYDAFEDLRVWQEAMKLCVDVHLSFRDCKNYGLRDQIQRSAVSVPSNIAEGFERQTDKDFIRFLYIAKASCGELRTQILIALSVSAIQQDKCQPLLHQARKISGMIQNLIKARRINSKRENMVRRK